MEPKVIGSTSDFAEELVCGVTENVACSMDRVEDSMVTDVFNFMGQVSIQSIDELVELVTHLGHASL